MVHCYSSPTKEYLYLNKCQIASLSEEIGRKQDCHWSVTLMQNAVPVGLTNITDCPGGSCTYRAQRKRACFSLVPCVPPNNDQKQNQHPRNLIQAFFGARQRAERSWRRSNGTCTHIKPLSEWPWLAGCQRAAGSVSVSAEPVFWRKLGLYFLRPMYLSGALKQKRGSSGYSRKSPP